jgi:hypothetical protein
MIRRLYIYLIAFISLEVVLWGLIALLRYVLAGGGLGEDTDRLSGALALLLVSVPVFGLHWWLAQRSALRDIQERSERLRAIFLFAVLLVTGLPAVQNGLAALDRLFLQVFGVDPFWAMFGGAQTLPDNVVAILINALAAGYFCWVTRGDGLALAQEDAAGGGATQYAQPWLETRRLYRYLWLLYALGLVLAGLQQLLLAGLTLWGSGDVQPWIRLSNGLTLLLVGLPLWLWLERLIQRSLRDPAEKISILRLAILYLVVFISLAVVLTAAGVALYDALRFVLGVAPAGAAFLAEIAPAISLILPFGLAWLYYYRLLAQAILAYAEVENGEGGARSGVPAAEREKLKPAGPGWPGTAAGRRARLRRLYYYFASLAGLVSTFIGLADLMDFLINLALDPASWSDPVLKTSLAAGLAALWVGLPVWILSWRPMQAEASQEGEAGDHARRALVRRGYLFLVLFTGVIGVMVSGGALLYELFQAIFGNPVPDLLKTLLPGLALLSMFGSLLAYHWQVLRQDSRLAQASLSRRYAQFPVLILAPEEEGDEAEKQPEAFTRNLLEAIQRQAPGVPVEVHAYSQGVPDESLAAAQAVILPAELVARPSEALRLWLQAFQGQRLVLPTPAHGWHWVGQGGTNMPSLARQAAQIVRQLAEGDRNPQGRENSPWMITAYLVAAVLGLILLFLLITAIINLMAL